MTTRQLLAKPVIALLGVAEVARTELAALGIETIFDLASSAVFDCARQLVQAAEGASRGLGRFGIVPGDLVDDGARTKKLTDLQLEPVSTLRAIDAPRAATLAAALGVSNIRELGLWPPYHAARVILSDAFGLDAAPGTDPDGPSDLVPGSGRFPTERVQYSVLVLDTVDDTASGGSGGSRHLEDAGQLDLGSVALESLGFTRPALGALLTYTQSWFSEGLSLGQLLHTVALAPGESTRIAMIDWSRRTSTSTQEGISETEALTSDLTRARSISEIVSAVAHEAQQGFSRSFGAGVGAQAGTASGGAGSLDLTSIVGLPLKLAGGNGESLGLGLGVSGAESSSWTTGQRDLSANMAQNVMDRTQQASNLARNRWATIVREVSQSESEKLSTRSVTNYNHMHALSIEYFEIVQLYRVAVELSRVTGCLFAPMKLLDFTRTGVVARYKRTIAAVGLTPQVRALQFAETDTLLLSSPVKVGDWGVSGINGINAMFGEPVGDPASGMLALPLNFFPMFLSYFEDAPLASFVLEFSGGSTVEIPVVTTVNPQIGKYNGVLVDLYGQTLDKATAFWNVVAIRARKKAGSENWSGNINLHFRMASLQREGFPKPQSGLTDSFLNVTLNISARDSAPVVFELGRTVSGRALRQHLMENQLYYSQAIWRSLDSATIAQMLSGYSYGGVPVLAQVDPLPVTVAGNFLVFRRHLPNNDTAAKAWDAWLTTRDIRIGERREELVPLPSGGVFAEAVLGRFNSAEKLDITRFWNWQDSPIPITPPDIAALQAGSRAQLENLTPGQLAPAVLNIASPPAEPDPQGLTAILQAIQNGSMFRDMSGLNSTIGFAQSALTRAFDAARDAATQAGENMKTAADIYRSSFGGQNAAIGPAGMQMPRAGAGSSPQSPRTISNAGGRINYGEKLDQRNDPGGLLLNNGTGEKPMFPFDAPGAPFGSPSMASQAFATDLGAPGGPSFQLASWPPTTAASGGAGPQKLLSGDTARAQAAQLLANAQPIKLPNGGDLRPGTIWNDNSILVSADWTYAYYLKNGDLYEWSTSQFLRNELLSAWQQGISSAQGLLILADAEVSLLAGIFAGPAVLIVAGLVDTGLKLYHNREQTRVAYQASWTVLAELDCIRTSSPELWSQLKKATFNAIIDNVPGEISLRTVAFWLGRIIRGAGQIAPDVALAALAKIITKVTAIVAVLHVPGLVGQALERAIADKVNDLQGAFAKENITISDNDAKALLRALNANQQAIECVGDLAKALDDLQPVLQRLLPVVL